MVKSKLIMKKPKKPMNAMEAYRKKQKTKEKEKHKKDRYDSRDTRQKDDKERKHPSGLIHKHNDDDDKDDHFEGEEDFMDLDPEAVQQILQQKQRLREKRYDEPVNKTSIQDLYESFAKKPAPSQPTVQANPQPTRPEQPVRPAGPSNISSFMGDNILRSHNAMQRDPMDPHKPILPVNQPQMQPSVVSKTAIGDKRLQKRDNAGGSMDPFMMTTMQGDYDPTQRNKNKQQEAGPQANPLLGNYVSQAPGVYKAVNQQFAAPPKPVNTGPTVIMKSAALTSAPLRSQMEKEKSTLVPVNVLKKKAAPPKPENEELSRPNQSTLNIGIQNVTNVPAPRTNFGFSQNIQQNIGQNDQLSAFLSEISKLDES